MNDSYPDIVPVSDGDPPSAPGAVWCLGGSESVSDRLVDTRTAAAWGSLGPGH